MNLNLPITTIKGIGEKTQKAFAKLGVYTIWDILLRFPRNYVKYPTIEDMNAILEFKEGIFSIHAMIQSRPVTKRLKNMTVTVLTIGEEHKLQLVWFRMPYIAKNLEYGKEYVFYGKIIKKNHGYLMEQPVIYELAKYKEIENLLQPVYGLTSGITNNLMVKTLKQILADLKHMDDYLPEEIRNKYHLCDYTSAFMQIHFPMSTEDLLEARKCLAFHEFFVFLLGIQFQKENREQLSNNFTFQKDTFIETCIKKLPYDLTNAQKSAISDIKNDMESNVVMQRLIQGDVGSGKTIVAFLAMAYCAHNGYQSAIMAPTEVLARQHYDNFQSLCEKFDLHFPVILLTGSMKQKEKKIAYEKIIACKNALIIGTHALIQEKAIYSNLALVVTDEQHRFGVKQRDSFSEKGSSPHVLIMSATPIPRTLAIILYGDFNITVIDELPAKRLPIKNCVVNTSYRKKAYDFIEKEIALGHQAYVICPLVEETEHMEGQNATDYAKTLTEIFSPEIKIGLLHGKMKNEAKNKIMNAFANNEIQILVSTTVVEVGVNVPNATVMMIEDANRFGLAQLHQLRGRVGRGDAQSYCIMINSSNSKVAEKRLNILNHSNDGFYIASEDLKLRGPGDMFGIRQSGDMVFHIADIYQDAKELQEASECVNEILQSDPNLEEHQHQKMKEQMQKFIYEQISKIVL